jgi:hypothetical protein
MLNAINQICSVISSSDQEAIARRCTIDTPLTRTSHHRPHSLPIQRLPLRRLDPIDCPCALRKGLAPCQWSSIHGSVVSKAHLSLPCASIFRLPAADVLPQPEISLRHTIYKLRQAWKWHRPCGCGGIRSICLLRADSTSLWQTIPIFARIVSCVLGT